MDGNAVINEVPDPFTAKDCWGYIAVTASSLIFFLLVFIASPRISSHYFESYGSLPKKKQIDWDTRMGSNIHAVLVSALSLYSLMFDVHTAANPVLNDAVLIRINISITLGYVIADFLVVSYHFREVGDTFTLVHHLMAMIAYYFVVVYGILPYFANFRQLAEISTPCVNQRWFYDTCGYPKSSPGFVRNAICMGAAFILCRFVVMPFYYYKCYSVWGTPEQRGLGLLCNFFWISTCVVLDLINTYWLTKMVRGAIKLSRTLKQETKKS